jgi:hypothetical protein
LYVVGLLIQLWWIAVRLLVFAGWDGLMEHGRDLSTAMMLVGMVALIGASWELVHRSRGRVRIGMVLTLVANVVGLALQLFWIYAMMTSRDLYLETLDPLSWVTSISYVLGVVGLATAAGRGTLVTSVIAVVLTVMVVIGPVQMLIFRAGGEQLLFWFNMALSPLRAVLLLIMVTAIAKRCYEPVRDPRRASRRFGLLVWLFAARAILACVMVGMGSVPVVTQLGLVGVETVLLALIVAAMWGIAQTQLPQLPRFSMHVGMIGVLTSVFLIAEILETVFDYGMEDWIEYRNYVAIESWQLAAAAIGGAVWMVAFWRYGKHAPALRRKLVVSALVFAAAVGYELIGDRHLWICEAIASVALIPAFRAMAKALAGDSVQTTADVFA